MPILRRSLTPQEKFRSLLKMRKKEIKQAFREGRIRYSDYKRMKKDIKVMLARTRPGLFGRYMVADVDADHLKQILAYTHGMSIDLPKGVNIHLYYRPFSRVSSLERLVMSKVHGINPPVGKIGGAHLLHSVMTEDLAKLFGEVPAREEEVTEFQPRKAPVERPSRARAPVSKGEQRIEKAPAVEKVLTQLPKRVPSKKKRISPQVVKRAISQMSLDDFAGEVVASEQARKPKPPETKKQQSLDKFGLGVSEKGKVSETKPEVKPRATTGKEISKTEEPRLGDRGFEKGVGKQVKTEEEVEKVEELVKKEPLSFKKFFSMRVKSKLSKAKKRVVTSGSIVKELGKAVGFDADYVRLVREAERLGIKDKYSSELSSLAYEEDVKKRRELVNRLDTEFKLHRKLKRLGLTFDEFSEFFGLRGQESKKLKMSDFEDMRKDYSKMRALAKSLLSGEAMSERAYANKRKVLEEMDKKYGGHFYTKFLLAKLHENVGKWEEAKRYYSEAEKLAKGKNLSKFKTQIQEHKSQFEAKGKRKEMREEPITSDAKEKVVVDVFNNNKQLGIGNVSSYREIRKKLSRYPHLLAEIDDVISKSKTKQELERKLNTVISSRLGPVHEVVSSDNLRKVESAIKKTGHPDLLLAKGDLLYKEDKLRALNYFRDLEKSGKDKVGYSAYMISRILADRGELDDALSYVRRSKAKYSHFDVQSKLSSLEVELLSKKAEMNKKMKKKNRMLTKEEKEKIIVDFFKNSKSYGTDKVRNLDDVLNLFSNHSKIKGDLETIIKRSKTADDLKKNLSGFVWDHHDALSVLMKTHKTDEARLRELKRVYSKTKHPDVASEIKNVQERIQIKKRTNKLLSTAKVLDKQVGIGKPSSLNELKDRLKKVELSIKSADGKYKVPIKLNESEIESAISSALKGDFSKWNNLVAKTKKLKKLTKVIDKELRRNRGQLGDWEKAVVYSIANMAEKDVDGAIKQVKDKVKIAKRLSELGVPVPWKIVGRSEPNLGDINNYLKWDVVKRAQSMIDSMNAAIRPLGRKPVSKFSDVVDLLSKSYELDKNQVASITMFVLATGRSPEYNKMVTKFTEVTKKAKKIVDRENKLFNSTARLITSKLPKQVSDAWLRVLKEMPEWRELGDVILTDEAVSHSEQVLSSLEKKIKVMKEFAKHGLPPRDDIVKEIEKYDGVLPKKFDELARKFANEGIKISTLGDAAKILSAIGKDEAYHAVLDFISGKRSSQDLVRQLRDIRYETLLGKFGDGEKYDKEFLNNLPAFKKILRAKPELGERLVSTLKKDIGEATSIQDLVKILPKLDRAVLVLDGSKHYKDLENTLKLWATRYNEIIGSKLSSGYKKFLKTGDISELKASLDKLSTGKDAATWAELVRTIRTIRDENPSIYFRSKLNEIESLLSSKRVSSPADFLYEGGGVRLDRLLSVGDEFISKVKSELGDKATFLDDVKNLYNETMKLGNDETALLMERPITKSRYEDLKNRITRYKDMLNEDVSDTLKLDTPNARGSLADHFMQSMEVVHDSRGLLDSRISGRTFNSEVDSVYKKLDYLRRLPDDVRKEVANELYDLYPDYKLLALPMSEIEKVSKRVIKSKRKSEKRERKQQKKLEKEKARKSFSELRDIIEENEENGKRFILLQPIMESELPSNKSVSRSDRKALRFYKEIKEFFTRDIRNLPEEYINPDTLPGMLVSMTPEDFNRLKRRHKLLTELNKKPISSVLGIDAERGTLLDVLASRLANDKSLSHDSLLDLHKLPDERITEELGKINEVAEQLRKLDKKTRKIAVEEYRRINKKSILEIDPKSLPRFLEYISSGEYKEFRALDPDRAKETEKPKTSQSKSSKKKDVDVDDIFGELDELEDLVDSKK